MITRTLAWMMLLALPATVGLMATSDRWMPMLFGEGFREGGPWLALIAVRLPFVLASNIQQSALIACRREGLALRLMLGMLVLGLVALPPLARFQGAWGVAWGVLGVEVLGAVGGWLALRGLGVAPPWHHASGPALAGCLGLLIICSIGRDWPLAGVVIAGAGVYSGLVFLMTFGWPLAFSSPPLPRGEGPGVGVVASPPARIEGIIVDHPTRHDPHPGPLPKSEGGRNTCDAMVYGSINVFGANPALTGTPRSFSAPHR
jgi:hypothetical protein